MSNKSYSSGRDNQKSWKTRRESIYAIDFEASGLFGYPIEIGWCAVGSDVPSSCLIKPAPEWIDRYPWDEVSAEIHGIPFEDLMRFGLPPVAAVEFFLSELSPSPILYSDASGFDQRWMDLLFDAAGYPAAPFLRSAPSFDDPNDNAVHRAGPDALALARQLAAYKI